MGPLRPWMSSLRPEMGPPNPGMGPIRPWMGSPRPVMDPLMSEKGVLRTGMDPFRSGKGPLEPENWKMPSQARNEPYQSWNGSPRIWDYPCDRSRDTGGLEGQSNPQ